HIYTKGGIYDVTLKVIDAKGANYTITKQAKIYPLADAGDDKTVKVNKPVEFKGKGETLDADFERFWWECNQDGIWDDWWPKSKSEHIREQPVGIVIRWFNTTYTYYDVRVYNATFGLRDTWDATAEDICVVTVVPNKPPVANAGPDRFVRYYTYVTFDGSKSYDIDGVIINYTWDFGDGSVGYGVNCAYVYTTPGTYTVTLTVKDDDGATNSDICIVTVTDNRPPVANAGPDQYVYVHQIVQFNGSASFDPDGNIANYTWDFNDPYNQTSGYGATPTHIYTYPGIYRVTLTVTDDKGAKATDICLIYVYNNFPPEVDPGTDQIRPFGYPVNFYATAKDSDDRIVKMEWDYGDGKKDTKLLDETGIVTWDTKHMYCVPHGYENLTESITIKYNATLTVWDNRGGVNSSTCIIEMRLDLRPPAISNFSLPAKEFSYTRGIVNFTFEIVDDAAPPEFLRGYIYLDDNLYDKTYLDLTALSVGEHTLTLRAVDWICRESVEVIRFIVIDDVAPHLKIVSPESREYFYIEGPINITYYAYDEKDLHPEITILLDGTIFIENTINLMALAPGNHTLTIRAMDASGNIVERSVTFTLVKKATTLEVDDVVVQYSDTAILSATLTEALGPVSNREVLFFVDRIYIGKALTDSSGRANLSYTFDLPPKPYTLTVIFYGDYYYLPST
ncbi:MAG: PKD domain-containing protein, partial [Candidatus Thermoplasmatota archaeon]